LTRIRALRAVAALLAFASAACSAPLSRALLRADLREVRVERSATAASSFGLDAPGLVHVHTRLSHDSPAPLEELVSAARAAGVRWVCLTDHTNPETGHALPRGEVGGVLLVPGEEISLWSGALLALGADRSIERGDKKYPGVVGRVREAGGVPVYGHITHFHGTPPAIVDGIAVYDLSDDFRGTPVLRMPAALACVSSGDPEKSAEGYLLFVQTGQRDHRAIWDAFLARGPCAGVAETNAHAKFRYLGRTFDPFEGLVGLVRNHALVPGVDEASVLEAVRRGRLHVGFDAAADSSGARFEAFRGGRPVACGGDALPFDPALSLAVHLPLPARVRVLRDGVPWREGEGRVLQFPVDGPGVYRAEADLVVGGEGRPWVLFNPVRVLPAGEAAR